MIPRPVTEGRGTPPKASQDGQEQPDKECFKALIRADMERGLQRNRGERASSAVRRKAARVAAFRVS